MGDGVKDLAIAARNLTRDFGNLRAVDNLTLDVRIGEVFGFLGPNGSGKTTTIRLLLGLLDPSSGDAHVLGYDIRAQAGDIRAKSGALLEHNGLYERLTAQDNLDFFGKIWHMPANIRQSRIESLLVNLGLWERRNDVVGEWSRGMKQKLAVARAMLHKPGLLFLDEPTAGLDPVASTALRDDLAALAKLEGVTIFLTTHNLAEAESLCDRVAVIHQGRLLSVGAPGELRQGSGAPQLVISGRGFTPALVEELGKLEMIRTAAVEESTLVIKLTSIKDAAPVVTWLVKEGAEIEEIHRGRATLESVFLQLVEETNTVQKLN